MDHAIIMPHDQQHLAAGGIVVWTLDARSAAADKLLAYVSSDERLRASRFATPTLSRRFRAAHGLLRAALSRYTGLAPLDLMFAHDPCPNCGKPHGKPRLAPHAPAPDVRFSLSHSGELAGVALTIGAEVGVDVEEHDARRDIVRLARMVLSTGERERLRELPAPARQRAMFDAWTRKESVLKATGRGLADPLAGIEVPLVPGARFPTVAGPSSSRWNVADLDAGEGFSGAVAVAGHDRPVRVWRWPTVSPSGPRQV